jgi:predicted ATPase
MSVLVRQVTLRNYKSIGQCQVKLGDLTLFVGPNGAGKSNFIDAIRLITDALRSSLEYAIRARGGIGEVRRRSSGHPNHFNIHLLVNLYAEQDAAFSFQIGAQPKGGFVVQREVAAISRSGLEHAFYEINEGQIVNASSHLKDPPKVSRDRLFLTAVSGIEVFRPLFDVLSTMGFYNINPAEIREPQPNDAGEILDRSGSNLPSVVRRLQSDNPAALERIQAFLRQIVPGIEGVEYKALGPRETLEFRQEIRNTKYPWRFFAAAMSDGTLRSLGMLTALFQSVGRTTNTIPLVAIEEPESTIHPAAASVVMDALLEASDKEQVLTTTHSPDLLDHKAVKSAQLLAVENIGGETIIARVDNASISAIQDGLYTPGELLRAGQLNPDRRDPIKPLRQADLFARI